jgi:hypothetical protein
MLIEMVMKIVSGVSSCKLVAVVGQSVSISSLIQIHQLCVYVY